MNWIWPCSFWTTPWASTMREGVREVSLGAVELGMSSQMMPELSGRPDEPLLDNFVGESPLTS